MCEVLGKVLSVMFDSKGSLREMGANNQFVVVKVPFP